MTEITHQLPELDHIWQDSLSWQPNSQQQDKFRLLYDEIITANRQFNLTRITEPVDFWEKHLWDSLSALIGLSLIKHNELSVIDIGTGAGFPGIPVAIAFPYWNVTLLDSTAKKMNFVKGLIANLKLNNVKVLIGRAEEIGQSKNHREAYDLALIRAVSEAAVCAEYALPMLRLDGIAVLYRGNWTEIEKLSLQSAVDKLGGKIELLKSIQTPLSKGTRNCIYLRKVAPTPKQFPRMVGIPAQKPL